MMPMFSPHKTQSSLAFLNIPLRCFEKVTWRLLSSSSFFISTFWRPLVALVVLLLLFSFLLLVCFRVAIVITNKGSENSDMLLIVLGFEGEIKFKSGDSFIIECSMPLDSFF